MKYSEQQQQHVQQFSYKLLDWYRVHKRDLPWRRSRNPYHIWISEVMLQQTRVDTVIPYFHRFIEQFPTIEALADAPEENVLKAWEGLGYYSRARNLQSAVREVKERYGGVVPNTKEEISSLKGVGPYTAGAVLSIAYNKPEPAVDGNVMRVLSRYFLIQDDIMKMSTRVGMERLIYELIPQGMAGDFNQALMELGATVCTPKAPHCLTCPVMETCVGRQEGMELSLPVKTKAKPPRPERRLAALIEGSGEHEGKLLVRRRPAEGLLAKMWELPHVMAPGKESEWEVPHEVCIGYLREELHAEGLAVNPLEWFADTEHTFSHIHWNMRVYRSRIADSDGEYAQFPAQAQRLAPAMTETAASAESNDDEAEGPFYRWMSREEMLQLAFPNVFLRIIGQYWA